MGLRQWWLKRRELKRLRLHYEAYSLGLEAARDIGMPADCIFELGAAVVSARTALIEASTKRRARTTTKTEEMGR